MKNAIIYFLSGLSLLAVSCHDDGPGYAGAKINFESSELGFDSDETTKTITLQLSAVEDEDTRVDLSVENEGLTNDGDYQTDPEVADNLLSLTVPAGSSSVSFSISKSDGLFLSGDESVTFTITSVTSPVTVGPTSKLVLSFSSIVSDGSELTLNGGEGGSSAVNSVFVDFSNNEQTSVARASWDLGFYCGDEFRVILNNTTAAGAIALDKNDLAQVTAEDTVDLNLTVSYSNPDALSLIDNLGGDLDQTVIGGQSATDDENKVYIINRGVGGSTPSRAWKKIRILRNEENDGYILQYAGVEDQTYDTLHINKNEDYNFRYISFDDGPVSVEPEKNKWDMEWTGSIYSTSYGGTDVAYYFSDMVFINYLNNVTVAEVDTSDIAYAGFSEDDISSLSFSSERNYIGSGWRSTTGSSIGVKADHYYIIKDSKDNYYKLKFINFTSNDGGIRGYPEIAYGLVKKGS